MKAMTSEEVLQAMESLNDTLAIAILRKVDKYNQQEEYDALTIALNQIARLNYFYNNDFPSER